MSHCLCLTQARRQIHLNHITFSPALHHKARGQNLPTGTKQRSAEPEVCPSRLDEPGRSVQHRGSAQPHPRGSAQFAAAGGAAGARELTAPVFTAPSVPARNAQHIGARRLELPLALMEVWDINPTRGSEGIDASVSGLELSGSAPQGL